MTGADRFAARTHRTERPGIHRRRGRGAAVLLVLAMSVAACGTTATTGTTARASDSGSRVIVDTAGRHVRVPDNIKRVATIGTIPVMISYVFTMGEQGKIVTMGGQGGAAGVSAKGKQGFHNKLLYHEFAPNIFTSPSVEASINAPVNTEALLSVHPDVVIAPNTRIAAGAISAGIPVVILNSGRTGDDVKKEVAVMGALFNKAGQAKQFATYFDQVVHRVKSRTDTVPNDKRLSAVFLAFSPLRVPIYSTNYMFPIDGADSITRGNDGSNVQISVEQLIHWNPDVIVVQQEADRQALYTESKFAGLNAVRNHRVVLIPLAIQPWTDNSPEMPLGLLFLAKNFYPSLFTDLNLVTEVQKYFQQFGGFHVSDQVANEILNGKVG